jgi:Zn-dependent M28 family amino/carboxypeptidase
MKNYYFGVLWVAAHILPVASIRHKSRSSENLRSYVSTGLAVPRQALVGQLTKAITSNDWNTTEVNIVNIAPSRHSTHVGISKSAELIRERLAQLGLQVSDDKYDTEYGPNIIGAKMGDIPESILIGAHYDSLPAHGPAPGADDNASGVATLLSVARSLASTHLKRGLVFVAFSGEEQGLVGSRNFAAKLAPSLNITSAIILDQDGNPGVSHGIILESIGNRDDRLRIIDTLADSKDAALGSISVNYDGFGSDHVSLSEINIPSVLVIERDNMQFAGEYGHTSRDDLSHVDPEFGSAIARTVAEAVFRLAQA